MENVIALIIYAHFFDTTAITVAQGYSDEDGIQAQRYWEGMSIFHFFLSGLTDVSEWLEGRYETINQLAS